VVGTFAVAVLAGWASIPLLMATGFPLGSGQTLVAGALLPLMGLLALGSINRHTIDQALAGQAQTVDGRGAG
jgi:hypothetical protein